MDLLFVLSLYFRNIANFLDALKINIPKNHPERAPQIIWTIIEVSVVYQPFTKFMSQKKMTETIVVPNMEMHKKNVLNPLLTDLCCSPTRTEAEIMPQLKRINNAKKKCLNHYVNGNINLEYSYMLDFNKHMGQKQRVSIYNYELK